jgi:hypothetical protein
VRCYACIHTDFSHRLVHGFQKPVLRYEPRPPHQVPRLLTLNFEGKGNVLGTTVEGLVTFRLWVKWNNSSGKQNWANKFLSRLPRFIEIAQAICAMLQTYGTARQNNTHFKLNLKRSILPGELTVAQLVTIFSAFYSTRMSITMFTRTHHWFPP